MKEATVEYLPRDQFQPFHRRNQRRAIIVAHRRAGKTVATINDLIWRALRAPRILSSANLLLFWLAPVFG
jgi:hypothetical protein